MIIEDKIINKNNEWSKQILWRQNGGSIINNRVGGVLAVTRAFGDFMLK